MSTDAELAGSIDLDVNPFLNSLNRVQAAWTTSTDDFMKSFTNISSFADKTMGSMQGWSSSMKSAVSDIIEPIADLTRKVFDVGAAFDDSFDRIRIGTGATGAALAGLQDSFRNVAGNVPSTFEDVSKSLTLLSQRTNQTGADLEAMATTQLNLSRITGGDLATQIQKTTRLFGDWSIATASQTPALDSLLKVSQATGIQVNSLASSLVRYGAPLREMGFSFDQAAAMMGKFEKEGVNLDMVLSGMKMALGKMAKAGVEPVQGLQMLIDRIKDAGSAAEANSLGVKAFGLRAGVDMVRAIKEGRFELAAMVDQISKSGETIAGASADTADFAESWVTFKNKLMLAIEPLSGDLFSGLNSLIPTLQPIIDGVKNAVDWFGKLPDAVKQSTAVFGGLSFAAAAVAPVIGTVATAIGALSAPVVAIGAGIAVFAAAYVGNWGGIHDKVNALVSDLTKVYEDHKTQIDATVAGVGEALKLAGKLWADNVGQTIDSIRFFVRVVNGDWKGAWDLASQISQENAEKSKQDAENLRNWLGEKWTGIKTDLVDAWDGIKAGLSDAWNNIKTLASSTWDGVVNFFSSIPERIGYSLGNLAGRIVSFFTDSKESSTTSAAGLVDGVVNWFSQLPGRAIGFFSDLANGALEWFGKAKTWAIQGATNIYNGVSEWLGKVPELVTGAWDSILNYLEGVPGKVYTKLESIGKSMTKGYRDGSNTHSPSEIEMLVTEMVDNVSQKLDKMLGESGPKAKKSGAAILDGFKSGVTGLDTAFDFLGDKLGGDFDKMVSILTPKVKKGAEQIKQAFQQTLGDVNSWLNSSAGGSSGLSQEVFIALLRDFPKLIDKAVEQADAFKRINQNLEVYGFLMQSADGQNTQVARSIKGAIDKLIDFDKQLRETATLVPVMANLGGVIQAKLTPQIANLGGQIEDVKFIVDEFGNITTEKAYKSLQKLSDAGFKALSDAAEDAAQRLPDSWNSIIDAIVNGSGKVGSAVYEMAIKIKGVAGDILGVIDTIPGKWGDSVRKITDTATQFATFVDKVLGLLNRFNSSIPGSLGGMVEKILASFKKTQTTVQTSIQGITGTIQGASEDWAGELYNMSVGMGDAVKTGLDNANNVAKTGMSNMMSTVSKAAAAIGGVLAGIGTFMGTRHQGKVAGVLGGAMGGFEAGAGIGFLFGGPVGAGIGGAIGAGVGAIAGLFGSGKSKEQKAAEEAAKQKAGLDMQKLAADILQSQLDGLQKGLALLESLADFTTIPRKNIKRFMNEMELLLSMFADMAGRFTAQSIESSKALAEAMGPAIDTIGGALNVFSVLPSFIPVAGKILDEFFDSFAALVTKFGAMAESIPNALQKQARKFADRVAPAVELISATVEALFGDRDNKKGVIDGKAIDTAIFDALGDGINLIITKMTGIAATVDNSLLKVTQRFSEKTLPVFQLVQGVVETFGKFKDIQIPSTETLDGALSFAKTMIDKVSGLAATLNVDFLGRSEQIAARAGGILTFISGFMEGLGVLGTYKGVDDTALNLITSDLEKVLAWGSNLLTLAEAGIGKFDALQSAISKMAASMKGAASGISGLSAGLSREGGGITSSIQYGGGGVSLSRGGGGASSYHQEIHVHLTVQGSLIEQGKIEDAVVAAVQKAQSRGRLVEPHTAAETVFRRKAQDLKLRSSS